MQRSFSGKKRLSKDRDRSIIAVSEAVGTVLLLGISMTLAGGVALWVSQIDEGEENIYVDLWASVQGTDLIITHRGGDQLGGGGTKIMISDSSGNQVLTGTYSDLSGTTGETWGPGEELVIDISDPSITSNFKVVITAQRESGESVVILNNELVKSGDLGGLPDLAVTLVNILGEEGTNTVLENGAYDIVVRVTNFGADMDVAHMTDAGNGVVENLRIFDSNEPIEMESVVLRHYDSSGVEKTADFGILKNDEYMEFTYTWAVPSNEPRSLGTHTLNVKVIPVFSGEQDYRNNYIEKRFRVDKELTPLDIHGPDPGIYDIYFSNEAPNSGEEVTVTVILQNSGDEPVTADMGLNMIVTTWEPKRFHDGYDNSEVHDWKMDYEGYYGEWRSDHSEEVPVTQDEEFPTCVRTDLELLPGAYLFYYFNLEARVDVPGGEQWVYAAVDVYNDNIKPQAIGYNPGGDDPGDNMRLGKIQVLPRILLVDDDQAPTGSDGDLTSTVLESLVGAGVTVDKIFVAQQVNDYVEGKSVTRDAPAFNYNQDEIAAPAMEDYDIVIWVTGYVMDPLTNSPNDPVTGFGGNIQELMKYMDSNRYLMIVGTDPFKGLMVNFKSQVTTDVIGKDTIHYDASNFLYKYLGIEVISNDVDIPVEDPTVFHGMDIFAELEASIQDGQLVISHEGGDSLYSTGTFIEIIDQGGIPQISGTYSTLSGTAGDWSSGMDLDISLSTLDPGFTYDIEITSKRDSGSDIIVYKNQLFIPVSGDPELVLSDTYPGGVSSRDFTIELLDQTAGNGDMNLFVPRDVFKEDKFEIPVGILTTATESGESDAMFNSIRSFSTPDPDLYGASYRAVVLAWNASQIKYLNEKVDIFSDLLNWFDWEVEVGRDLAVTRMDLHILKEEETGWINEPVSDDNSPKYLDTVLIEAHIRNNGPNPESTSVMFYVTGPDGVELPITPNIPDPRNGLEPEEYDNPHDINGLSGDGNEEQIYKLWLAVGVGTYTFRVVVDPFHLITEISEENNDISYSTSTITSFVTKNNILVVDDDMSVDNFPDGMDPVVMGERLIGYSYLGGEPSSVVEKSLYSEGYAYSLDYDFDSHIVLNDKPDGTWDYESGLSILDLKRYNSILWVTGDSGLDDTMYRETFTDDDLEAIKRYLDGDYPEAKYLPDDHHENLMIIGSNFMTELTQSNDEIEMSMGTYFLYDIIEEYFGVNAAAPFSGTGVSLRGPTDGKTTDKVYLGIDYPQTRLDSDFSISSIHPVGVAVDEYAETIEGLWAEDTNGNRHLVSTQYNYDNTGSTNTEIRNFQVVLHSWQLTRSSILSEESPLREMLYLPLHWFDTPEDEPELVGRSCTISIDSDNPVIGNSYVIQAEVANIGGVPGGGTVRFMDGATLVQSENIYLNSDTTTTIEAIWKPLYAGERTITIWIDKYNDYGEVFDVINNAPSMTLDVYFFWDDMESGDGNWEHDTTLMRINGEGTLDYMAEPTETNIEKDWLNMDGFHVNTEVENTVIQGEFFSSPNSFYMYEPNLGGVSRKDLDLILMLDTSISMDGTPLSEMKIAAKGIVDELTGYDRLAIFAFDGNGKFDPKLSFTYMNPVKKEEAKALIDDLVAGGSRPLWDSIGDTVNYATSNKRTTNVYTAAITLSHGDDYGYDSLDMGREDGSSVYCPGSEIGTSYNTRTWGTLNGLKWGDTPYDFENQGGFTGQDVQRVGGYAAPLTGKWLNLADGSRTGLIYAPVPIFTVGLGISPHENDPTSPTIASYELTTEYDLRQIATTSKGEYHYAPDPSQLKTTYETVFNKIVQNAQISTRGSPTRSVGLWTDGDEVPRNKYMDTNTIDLTNTDDVELTFNHKFNMKDSSNGGVIMVGTDNDGDGIWSFKYIQPDQPYNGNFPEDEWDTHVDGFNNVMRWCWNGLSGGGNLDWDRVTVDLSDYIGERIRIRFQYYHFIGGTGYGWIIDDVELKISTYDTNPNKYQSLDSWTLQNASTFEPSAGGGPLGKGVGSYSGYHAWFIGDPAAGGDLRPGVDNSLYTRQIDLTNARTAKLEAMFRFNIDTAPGRPPDGFRVEVSTDNKQTWVPLNLGVRSAWGVSGTEADADDGLPGDGKSYTGIVQEGDSNNWVPAYTLTRLSTDLDTFRGKVINLRFRVTTNTDSDHYADSTRDMGIYIDDVFVYGTSLASARNSIDITDFKDGNYAEEIENVPSNKELEERKIGIDPKQKDGEAAPDDPADEMILHDDGKEKLRIAPIIILISLVLAAIPVAIFLITRKRGNL